MVWAQVLVIILSVFLAVFLLLAIVLAIKLIKLTRQIKRVTDVAERTAVKFEAIAGNVVAVTSPMAPLKIITRFIKRAKK